MPAIARRMTGIETSVYVEDMNVDAMIGSALERIAPISRQIWDAKYRLKAADGTPVDLTIEDT